MNDASKKGLPDLLAGYCVLDVASASVDGSAVQNVDREPVLISSPDVRAAKASVVPPGPNSRRCGLPASTLFAGDTGTIALWKSRCRPRGPGT